MEPSVENDDEFLTLEDLRKIPRPPAESTVTLSWDGKRFFWSPGVGCFRATPVRYNPNGPAGDKIIMSDPD